MSVNVPEAFRDSYRFEPVEFYRATVVTRTPDAIARMNGQTTERIKELNPGRMWPVNAGTSVRIM